MSLAIFDLDNTLIGGDSDHLWGEFLCDEGIIADRQSFQKKNDYFYQQYELGLLDIYAWAEFSFEILARHSMKKLDELHHKFMITKIEPIILDKAQKCIDNHKKNGDTVLVITASNTFVTSPIVKRYGIDHYLLLSQRLNRDAIVERFQEFHVFSQERSIICCHGWFKIMKLWMVRFFILTRTMTFHF